MRESKFFLPNIKLHTKNDRNGIDKDGYELMRTFVYRRMKEELIEPEALDFAIKMSGDVFREGARIMQIAADSAIENERGRMRILINFGFKEICKTFRSYSRVWHLFCDFFAPKQANFPPFLGFCR
jgi:hypothetical protein